MFRLAKCKLSAHAFDGNVRRINGRCIRSRIEAVARLFLQRQMRHSHIRSLFRIQLLTQLLLLELELDLHGATRGLDLDDLSVGILREEGDVIEQGVLGGVGVLLASVLVQGFHIGVVVVTSDRGGNGRHLELGVIGDCICRLERSGNLDRAVLVLVRALLRGWLRLLSFTRLVVRSHLFGVSRFLGRHTLVDRSRFLCRSYFFDRSRFLSRSCLLCRGNLLDNRLELVHLLCQRSDWS